MATRRVERRTESEAAIGGLIAIGVVTALNAGVDLLGKWYQHRRVEKMLKRAVDAGLYVATYEHEQGGTHYRFFTEDRYYFQGGEIYTARGLKEANDFLNGYEKRGLVVVA